MANELEFPPHKPKASVSHEENPQTVAQVMERRKKAAQSKALLEQSTHLLSTLFQLIKTSQLHDLNNVAFQSPLEGFCKAINNLQSEDEFQALFVEDLVYVNENRLRTDITNFLSIKNLSNEFQIRSLGGLTFRKGITTEELKDFILAFINLDQKLDSPLDALKETMEGKKITSITVEPIRAMNEGEKTPVTKADRSKVAMKTYFKAISSYKSIMKNIKNNRLDDARKAKKIVQRLVDLCNEEGFSLLGLTTIKNYDDYTYNHSVNVCILSIAFGQKLGLNKQQLCDLGAAALFHDIGKTSIPIKILNKTSKFTEQEWALIQAHPVLGVKALLRMKGFSDSTIYRILVAHQHHIGMDGSGYPQRRNPTPVHFYTKIVSICDTFDAMTTSRVYQKAMAPDEALRLMSKTVQKRYDPLLLKAFINTIGIFPIGTLVQLNTKEIAVVVEGHDDPTLIRQPKVKVIMGPDRKFFPEPRSLDLADKKADGSFKFSIQKSLDPKEFRINIPHYVLT